jgi:recombination protein RecA
MLEQIADKMRALKGVIVAVEKQFGKGAVMTLGDDEDPEPVATIPTGSLALDLATGIGGYPRGRVVEVYGPESSGKTTLALHAIAEAQKMGGVCAFIDAEHALDVAYARAIGVLTDKLLISQPDTGEQALDITEMLVRSGAVDLVVIDSVAALTPKAELEGDMGDAHMGLQARLMSQALRKLTAAAYRGGTTLMFLNQLRQKIGVTFGSPETTTGGNALKFYASMRFDVRRIGQVKIGDEPVGGRTRVKLAKNKCAPPNRSPHGNEQNRHVGGNVQRNRGPRVAVQPPRALGSRVPPAVVEDRAHDDQHRGPERDEDRAVDREQPTRARLHRLPPTKSVASALSASFVASHTPDCAAWSCLSSQSVLSTSPWPARHAFEMTVSSLQRKPDTTESACWQYCRAALLVSLSCSCARCQAS